jgi:hypothetical protein
MSPAPSRGSVKHLHHLFSVYCLNGCFFLTQSGNVPVARKRQSGECLLSRDGDARLLVAQDRETIIHELRNAIAEAVDALRPITADEATTRDIVPNI